MKFSASTGSAREELRNLDSNPKIIQYFIDEISAKNHWSEQLAKTIFELLISIDFKGIKIASDWLEKYLESDNQFNAFSNANGVYATANVLLTRLCLEPAGKAKPADIASLAVTSWSNGCLIVNNQLNTENIYFLQTVLT